MSPLNSSADTADCSHLAPIAGGQGLTDAVPNACRVRRIEISGQVYYLYCPPTIDASTRILVSVHGISRNARAHAEAFAAMAARLNWVVMAPLFGREQFPDYQWLGLGHRGSGVRADQALNTLLADLTQRTGVDSRQFYLFGFSGGAQFAQRYALLHPERIHRLALASAGFYTFPDFSAPYPRGLAAKRRQPQPLWLLEAALCVPTAVFVGERDCRRDRALRKGPRVDAQQGAHRVQRAERWVQAMAQALSRRDLETPLVLKKLAGCRHQFDQCVSKGSLNLEVMGFFTQAAPFRSSGKAERDPSTLLQFIA
ncbi:alpha/beta fold hydrolase [Motiliproteus sp. SC1-56]|uniref:alpha/beta hydrolase family protein n=1 Tax=Motiliproteus sp. SC1-56 TaxID=2799565 RepID=UPI001A8FC3A2|nr:alpha/beta hydrolase [Motiliproteus sp. SC1-56]